MAWWSHLKLYHPRNSLSVFIAVKLLFGLHHPSFIAMKLSLSRHCHLFIHVKLSFSLQHPSFIAMKLSLGLYSHLFIAVKLSFVFDRPSFTIMKLSLGLHRYLFITMKLFFGLHRHSFITILHQLFTNVVCTFTHLVFVFILPRKSHKDPKNYKTIQN
ncbi:hypothetical protein Bca4012_018679 [Brassica carinata]